MSTARSLLNEHNPRILPGLPRKPLTPEQQLEALRKVQAQAEQRVKLGMQLFKSAEARLAAHADLVAQVRSEQKYLREKVNEELDRSVRGCETKLEHFDDRLTEAIKAIEDKMDAIASEWREARSQIELIRSRCESMLDQSRLLLEQASGPVRLTRPVGESARPVAAAQARPTPAAPAAKDRSPVMPLEALEETDAVSLEPIEPVDASVASVPAGWAEGASPHDGPFSLSDLPAEVLGGDDAELSATDAADVAEPVSQPEDEERIYSQILERLRQSDQTAA